MSLELKDASIPRPLWQRIRGMLVCGPNGKLMVDDGPPRAPREFAGVAMGILWGAVILALLVWALS